MSLYELLSTSAELDAMEHENSPAPSVSDEDWQKSMDVISNLAQFDPTLRLE